MGLDEMLESFKRYRRACKEYPSQDWPEDVHEQYLSDRKRLNEAYASKRHEGFGIASDYTHEVLFLRCFGLR